MNLVRKRMLWEIIEFMKSAPAAGQNHYIQYIHRIPYYIQYIHGTAAGKGYYSWGVIIVKAPRVNG